MRVRTEKLTSAQRRAMNQEIRNQLAEYDRKNELEIDAMVLWVLHEEFGFGLKRLRQFYDAFSSVMDKLVERYVMDDSDQPWLCTYKLKEIGIDLDEWRKEKEND